MKNVFKAVAIVTIFSIITRFLGFFFRIYLTRKLGSLGIGIFQMSASILGIFMTIVASGLPLTTAKFVSKYETESKLKKRNEVVTSSAIIALSFGIASVLLIVLLKDVWNKILSNSYAGNILLILSPSIIFSSVYAIFRGALWGQSDFFNCGLTELLEQVIRFVLTVLFLSKTTDVITSTKYSAFAFDLTCLVSAIIVCFAYFKKGKLAFSKREYKKIFKSATPITLVRISNSFVQPLTSILIPNLLILAGYNQAEALSAYGIVMGMTFPLLFVPMSVIGSINMVLVPKISSCLSKKDYNSIFSIIEKSTAISMFLSILFVPLYISVGDKIGIVLYNNLTSGVLLQISAVCVVPITLCSLSGAILNSLNLETKSFINYIFGSIVLILGLIALTPTLSISAVCISYFLSMSTISVLNFRKIKKWLNLTTEKKDLNIFSSLIKYLCIIIPSSLFGNWISNIIVHFSGNFLSAVTGGIVACSTCLVLIIILKIFDLELIKTYLKERKSKKA